MGNCLFSTRILQEVVFAFKLLFFYFFFPWCNLEIKDVVCSFEHFV